MNDGNPTQLNFNIPKIKKKTSKDNLRSVSLTSRDAVDIVQIIDQRCLDHAYRDQWEVSAIQVVDNPDLETSYRKKRLELKEDGRHNRELSEQFCFLSVRSDHQLANKVVKQGLKTRLLSISPLGDSKSGVYVCRHPDVQLRVADGRDEAKACICVFKVTLGRCKSMPVASQDSIVEPTPNFDSHVSATPSQPSDPPMTQMLRSQVYLFEYTDEALPSEYPRHCLPYALVDFKKNRSKSATRPRSSYDRCADSGRMEAEPWTARMSRRSKESGAGDARSEPEGFRSEHLYYSSGEGRRSSIESQYPSRVDVRRESGDELNIAAGMMFPFKGEGFPQSQKLTIPIMTPNMIPSWREDFQATARRRSMEIQQSSDPGQLPGDGANSPVPEAKILSPEIQTMIKTVNELWGRAPEFGQVPQSSESESASTFDKFVEPFLSEFNFRSSEIPASASFQNNPLLSKRVDPRIGKSGPMVQDPNLKQKIPNVVGLSTEADIKDLNETIEALNDNKQVVGFVDHGKQHGASVLYPGATVEAHGSNKDSVQTYLDTSPTEKSESSSTSVTSRSGKKKISLKDYSSRVSVSKKMQVTSDTSAKISPAVDSIVDSVSKVSDSTSESVYDPASVGLKGEIKSAEISCIKLSDRDNITVESVEDKLKSSLTSEQITQQHISGYSTPVRDDRFGSPKSPVHDPNSVDTTQTKFRIPVSFDSPRNTEFTSFDSPSGSSGQSLYSPSKPALYSSPVGSYKSIFSPPLSDPDISDVEQSTKAVSDSSVIGQEMESSDRPMISSQDVYRTSGLAAGVLDQPSSVTVQDLVSKLQAIGNLQDVLQKYKFPLPSSGTASHIQITPAMAKPPNLLGSQDYDVDMRLQKDAVQHYRPVECSDKDAQRLGFKSKKVPTYHMGYEEAFSGSENSTYIPRSVSPSRDRSEHLSHTQWKMAARTGRDEQARYARQRSPRRPQSPRSPRSPRRRNSWTRYEAGVNAYGDVDMRCLWKQDSRRSEESRGSRPVGASRSEPALHHTHTGTETSMDQRVEEGTSATLRSYDIKSYPTTPEKRRLDSPEFGIWVGPNNVIQGGQLSKEADYTPRKLLAVSTSAMIARNISSEFEEMEKEKTGVIEKDSLTHDAVKSDSGSRELSKQQLVTEIIKKSNVISKPLGNPIDCVVSTATVSPEQPGIMSGAVAALAALWSSQEVVSKKLIPDQSEELQQANITRYKTEKSLEAISTVRVTDNARIVTSETPPTITRTTTPELSLSVTTAIQSPVDVLNKHEEITDKDILVQTPEKYPNVDKDILVQTPEKYPNVDKDILVQTPEKHPNVDKDNLVQTPEKHPNVDKDILVETPEKYPNVDKDILVQTPEKYPNVDKDILVQTPEKHPNVDKDIRVQTPEKHPNVDKDILVQTPEKHPNVDKDILVQTPEKHPNVDKDILVQTPEKHPNVDKDILVQTPEGHPNVDNLESQSSDDVKVESNTDVKTYGSVFQTKSGWSQWSHFASDDFNMEIDYTDFSFDMPHQFEETIPDGIGSPDIPDNRSGENTPVQDEMQHDHDQDAENRSSTPLVDERPHDNLSFTSVSTATPIIVSNLITSTSAVIHEPLAVIHQSAYQPLTSHQLVKDTLVTTSSSSKHFTPIDSPYIVNTKFTNSSTATKDHTGKAGDSDHLSRQGTPVQDEPYLTSHSADQQFNSCAVFHENKNYSVFQTTQFSHTAHLQSGKSLFRNQPDISNSGCQSAFQPAVGGSPQHSGETKSRKSIKSEKCKEKTFEKLLQVCLVDFRKITKQDLKDNCVMCQNTSSLTRRFSTKHTRKLGKRNEAHQKFVSCSLDDKDFKSGQTVGTDIKFKLDDTETDVKSQLIPADLDVKSIPFLTEKDNKPVLTEKDDKPVLTEKDTKPVITEKDDKPVTTEKDDKPVITEKDDTSVLTEKDDKPVITGKDDKPVISKKDDELVITKKNDKPDVADVDITPKPVTVEKEHKPDVTSIDVLPTPVDINDFKHRTVVGNDITPKPVSKKYATLKLVENECDDKSKVVGANIDNTLKQDVDVNVTCKQVPYEDDVDVKPKLVATEKSLRPKSALIDPDVKPNLITIEKDVKPKLVVKPKSILIDPDVNVRLITTDKDEQSKPVDPEDIKPQMVISDKDVKSTLVAADTLQSSVARMQYDSDVGSETKPNVKKEMEERQACPNEMDRDDDQQENSETFWHNVASLSKKKRESLKKELEKDTKHVKEPGHSNGESKKGDDNSMKDVEKTCHESDMKNILKTGDPEDIDIIGTHTQVQMPCTMEKKTLSIKFKKKETKNSEESALSDSVLNIQRISTIGKTYSGDQERNKQTGSVSTVKESPLINSIETVSSISQSEDNMGRNIELITAKVSLSSDVRYEKHGQPQSGMSGQSIPVLGAARGTTQKNEKPTSVLVTSEWSTQTSSYQQVPTLSCPSMSHFAGTPLIRNPAVPSSVSYVSQNPHGFVSSQSAPYLSVHSLSHTQPVQTVNYAQPVHSLTPSQSVQSVTQAQYVQSSSFTSQHMDIPSSVPVPSAAPSAVGGAFQPQVPHYHHLTTPRMANQFQPVVTNVLPHAGQPSTAIPSVGVQPVMPLNNPTGGYRILGRFVSYPQIPSTIQPLYSGMYQPDYYRPLAPVTHPQLVRPVQNPVQYSPYYPTTQKSSTKSSDLTEWFADIVAPKREQSRSPVHSESDDSLTSSISSDSRKRDLSTTSDCSKDAPLVKRNRPLVTNLRHVQLDDPGGGTASGLHSDQAQKKNSGSFLVHSSWDTSLGDMVCAGKDKKPTDSPSGNMLEMDHKLACKKFKNDGEVETTDSYHVQIKGVKESKTLENEGTWNDRDCIKYKKQNFKIDIFNSVNLKDNSSEGDENRDKRCVSSCSQTVDENYKTYTLEVEVSKTGKQSLPTSDKEADYNASDDSKIHGNKTPITSPSCKLPQNLLSQVTIQDLSAARRTILKALNQLPLTGANDFEGSKTPDNNTAAVVLSDNYDPSEPTAYSEEEGELSSDDSEDRNIKDDKEKRQNACGTGIDKYSEKLNISPKVYKSVGRSSKNYQTKKVASEWSSMLHPRKTDQHVSKPRRHVIDYKDDLTSGSYKQSSARKRKSVSLEKVGYEKRNRERSERRCSVKSSSPTRRQYEVKKFRPISCENISQETNKQTSERLKFRSTFTGLRSKQSDANRLQLRSFWKNTFQEIDDKTHSERTSSSKGEQTATNKLNSAQNDIGRDSNTNKLKSDVFGDVSQESDSTHRKSIKHVESGKETLTLRQFMKEKMNIADPSAIQRKLPWSLNLDINSQSRNKRKRIIHKAKIIASHHSVEKKKKKNTENNLVDSSLSDPSSLDSPNIVEEIKLEDFTKDKILLELQFVQECLKNCSVVNEPQKDTKLASVHNNHKLLSYNQPVFDNTLSHSRFSSALSNSLNKMSNLNTVGSKDYMFQSRDQAVKMKNLHRLEIHQTSTKFSHKDVNFNIQNPSYSSSIGSFAENIRYSENNLGGSLFEADIKEKEALIEALIEVENDLLEALRNQANIGRSHQKVPNDILFPSETSRLYTEEGCFLMLLVPICKKPYQRLMDIKINLQNLFKEKLICASENNTVRLMELNKEIKKVQNQRKNLLTTFTGSLGKKRLRRLNLIKNRYDLCLKYFIWQYGRECLDRLLYIQTVNKAVLSHVRIVERELACPSI